MKCECGCGGEVIGNNRYIYQHHRRKIKQPCEICGSTEGIIVHYKNKQYLCARHRAQMLKHGRITSIDRIKG